jgi:LPXTG-site transpeptidase (sortase) family protein
MKKFLLSCLVCIIVFGAAGLNPTPALASPQADTNLIHPKVIDLNPGKAGSSPHPLYTIGTTLFFSGNDGASGQELWKSVPPYTIESTSRVADINPGLGSSFPDKMTSVGTTLLFQADDGVHGKELWRSDPPYVQAYMVADIYPGAIGSTPDLLTPLGDELFFQANDGISGIELWKSGPPFTSAEKVKDVWEGQDDSNPRDLTAAGWTLLFTADDSSGREVWKSDPPYDAASTQRVMDINPFGSSSPAELTLLGNYVFFAAFDGVTREVWLSQPPFDQYTTRRLNEIVHTTTQITVDSHGHVKTNTVYYSSNPHELLAVGDDLFFSASLPFSGDELRFTEPPYDSTHTYRVADINKGPLSSNPSEKVSIDGNLLFVADDGIHGKELWKTISPYTTASLVMDINKGSAGSNIQDMLVVGKAVYFAADEGAGDQLWISTPPYDDLSTALVSKIMPAIGAAWPQNLTLIGRTLIFAADDEQYGTELRVIDNSVGYLPNSGFAPGKVTRLPQQPAAIKYNDDNGMQLSIPGQNVHVPLVGVPAEGKSWDLTWLGKQAGYLEGTAFPTLTGNAVIAGHAYTADGLPGPFANLENLKWGDHIEIQAWGQRYIYEVREVKRVAPNDLSVLGHEQDAWVTLITCQGFNDGAKAYLWRVVVRAVLVAVE